MSYAIDYFGGDYKPIQTGSPLDFTTSIPQNMGTGKDLFNGNIRATTVHLSQLGGAKTYSYSYDQLNRIVKMRKHETSFTYTGSGTPAITVASPTTEYQENITYDANGNILTYLRNGSSSQLAMDNLVYRYTTTHNRLRYVDDGVNAANYAEDIDDQASGNYNYDRIGNLILDVKEKISNIEWTVYGKIRKITKNDAAGTVIEYEYDASGNRIYKKVSANNITSYTFYVRDAQGNTLAVYTKEGQDPIKWSEQHLYGSSRVGMVNLNITVPANVSWPTPGNTMQDGFDYGKTVYELSNHLGNVLDTITDQKDAIIIETKDEVEFSSKIIQFKETGVAYSVLNLAENESQSDYNSYELEGRINLTTSVNDKYYKLEMLAHMFVHEAFGHGSGLSHSRIVADKEGTIPNGQKVLGNNPAKSGISSYANETSFQQWEIQAVTDAFIISIGGSLSPSNKTYYNIIADGTDQISYDAVLMAQQLKKKKQISFVKI